MRSEEQIYAESINDSNLRESAVSHGTVVPVSVSGNTQQKYSLNKVNEAPMYLLEQEPQLCMCAVMDTHCLCPQSYVASCYITQACHDAKGCLRSFWEQCCHL